MKAFADALIRSVAAGQMASLAWWMAMIFGYGAGPFPHIIVITAMAIGGVMTAVLFGMIVTTGYMPRQLHLAPIILGWLLAIPLSPLYWLVDVKDKDFSKENLFLCFLFVAAGATSTYILRFPKARA